MYTNAVLTKITSNHNRLRTDVIDGCFSEQPKIGSGFLFFSKPLDKVADGRIIKTSTVINVYYGANKSIIFETRNSVYKLEMK